MIILLKNAQIIDPNSDLNGAFRDILIEDGIIKQISESVTSKVDFEISSPELKVSIGWFDMAARFCDPGIEHKEDLQSGLKAAIHGGFTEVACLPTTKPIIQSKDTLHYLASKSAGSLAQLHIIAAATENLDSKAMTEIFDLHHAGAVAFSDGGHSISNSGLLVRLVQYISQIDGLLMLHSEDTTLTSHGVMHEGEVSVYLGQQGMSSISEYSMVSRNLELLKYAKGKLHFNKVSTSESVELIRNAKKNGLRVTCDVAVANLVFIDSDLTSFDTNLKINPPLRTKSDQEALWKGLADGTIDVIVTDHNPQDEESKKLEFDLADFGMTQLETAFSLLNKGFEDYLGLDILIQKITSNPRRLLKLDVPKIEVGAKANLTVFDPTIHWEYSEKTVKSKSRNSPVLGKSIKGKALAVFNKGQFVDLRK
jgi:dihydroorotase